MNKSAKKKTPKKCLVLDQSIDISSITLFYDKLNSILKKSDSVIIDAKHLKQIDTCAIQLICTWYTAAVDRGIKVTWENAEGVFAMAAQLSGLKSHLGLK